MKKAGTLVLAGILAICFSTLSFADGARNVKSGFFAYPGYHEINNDVRSGYGYDFLQLLGRYTNLRYEYTGYQNSWEDMLQMLLDGCIDLLTSARKNAQREALFDFSEPIGTNSARINVRLDDERFIPGDYAALDGIVIGELSGNSRNADTEAFPAEKGFHFTIKEYENAAELQEALQVGLVDAIATSSLRKSTNEKTVAEFAPQDFFCIVRKGDSELLNEINYGISQMDINEGNWRDNLYYKNYSTPADTYLSFSPRELEYIRKVRNEEITITVTAQPEKDPYSFISKGELTGIIADPEYLIVPTRQDSMKAVSEGRADACFVFTYMADKYINRNFDSNLQYRVLKEPVYDTMLYISPHTDHEICSILNKCIKTDVSGALDEYVAKYTAVTYEDLTLFQYIRLHPLVLLIPIILIVLAGALVAAVQVRTRMVRMKAEQLERDFRQQEKLKESLAFTNYFLDTYMSAYYVDLKTGECQVYKRTKELDEAYPIHAGYYESLLEYINKAVHPEDRENLIDAIKPDTMRNLLKEQIEYHHIYRSFENGYEHQIRMQVIRGADEDHAAFGFIDITDELKEQQKRFLGAIPLSPDILSKANIGLWAFELDEGKPPRMYVDDTMLGLLGLKEQLPPEDTYHAWYDNIDSGSYGLVIDAVNKMVAGEHAEVQYPWHCPDGQTIIVRCGGIPNPEYTKGIRIEGTHQNVTEVLHFDEKEIKRLRNAEIQLHHEQLRSEVLNYMVDHDDDPIELLKNFAERLRVLINCDQVIYRDLEETRIMVNSPAIEDTWHVPLEFCQQCEHFDAHHPMYAGGYTEMDNCQEGWQGIPVYHDCPIKSSLTRIVYCDNETAGYLAIHYVQDYHHFTDIERSTLEEFTRILSLSLSRYKARLENREKKRYDILHEIIHSGKWSFIVNEKDEIIKADYSDEVKRIINNDFSEAIHSWMDVVYPDDRENANSAFMATIADHSCNTPYDITYRMADRNGDYHWFHSAGRIVPADNGMREFFGIHIDISGQIEEQLRQKRELQDALSMAQSANRAKTTFLNSMSHDIRTPMNAIIGYTGLASKHAGDVEKVKEYLGKINQSGEYLLSLINAVLDMSRIESGKMRIEEKEENLRKIVDGLCSIVSWE